MFPLTPQLRDILEAQRRRAIDITKAGGPFERVLPLRSCGPRRSRGHTDQRLPRRVEGRVQGCRRPYPNSYMTSGAPQSGTSNAQECPALLR